MAIHIEYETELSLGIDVEPVITKVIDKALEIHQCPYAAEVNVILTDNASIAVINEEYRNLVQKILDGCLYPCEGTDILEKEMNEKTVEAFFHKYQFLTLSTCRTGEGRDARLLVIGCKKR